MFKLLVLIMLGSIVYVLFETSIDSAIGSFAPLGESLVDWLDAEGPIVLLLFILGMCSEWFLCWIEP